MALDDFLSPENLPQWKQTCYDKAEERGHEWVLDRTDLPKCLAISNGTECILANLHRLEYDEEREGRKTVYPKFESELEWMDSLDEFDIELEIVEVLGVILDYRSPGEYDPEHDYFYVIAGELWEEIPDSGSKRIRTEADGIRSPFDRYQDDWDRIFASL